MSVERIALGEPAPRLQAPVALAGEEELEGSLRPASLEEFIGQEGLRAQLRIAIEAASGRGDALDHVLLAGPPGLGKTSLARIVADELGVAFVATAGPALERKGDIAALLTALEPRAVFFIDEIHRLNRALEETLYPAMEDRRLPITIGQGAGAKVVTLELPAFTLIGATTRAGLLTTPLRDRFGIQHRLEPYGTDDLNLVMSDATRKRHFMGEDAPETELGTKAAKGAGEGEERQRSAHLPPPASLRFPKVSRPS